jgi:three-Cys-motif partner protein
MGCPTHLRFMPKVNLANYTNREQAYIKHCLLEEYLPDWAYKVGSTWDGLVYVDGFAGPWQTTHAEYADTSFGIAVQALRQCQDGLRARGRDLQIECILVDQDKKAFNQLRKFAELQRKPGFGIHALHGEFVERIGDIESIIKENTRNAFRFIFLDPKGWADIPMKSLQQFLRNRSCEVLINLMTRHIIRFLDEPDRADSYNNLFARRGVLENLRSSDMRNEPAHARAEQAVREYGLSLRLLCGFKYVSSAVILEPDAESIRYFLVYGTNHPKGVEVFKTAETKAAKIQEAVRYDTRVRKTHQPDLFFDEAPPSSKISSKLRQFYCDKARRKVLQVLSATRAQTKLPYSKIFCEAMAFPLVTPNDLVGWLSVLKPHITLEFGGSLRRQKFLPQEDDWILVIDPKSLH